MAEEDGDYKDTFSVLRMLDLYDKYAASFKENEMTDEEVTYCLKTNSSVLGDIIKAAGHRSRFMRHFTDRVRMTTPYAGQNARPEESETSALQSTLANTSATLDDPPPPYSSSDLDQSYLGHWSTVYVSGEATHSSQSQSQSFANPCERIAASLGLKFKSKQIICNKLEEIALSHYQEHVDEHFKQLTAVGDPDNELENVREEAEDAAYSFIEEVLGRDDADMGTVIKKFLQEEFLERAKVFRSKYEKKKKGWETDLEEMAKKICNSFIKVLSQTFDQGYVTKQIYDDAVNEARTSAVLEFKEACEDHPLYNEELFDEKWRVSAKQLWIQIEVNRSLLEKKAVEAANEAVEVYRNEISKCKKVENFQQEHESSFERGIKVIKGYNLDAAFETSAVEEYKKSVEKQRRAAEKLLVETAAKIQEEFSKLIESMTAEYTKLMNKSITSSQNPVYEETVTTKHLNASSRVVRQASDALDKLAEKFPLYADKNSEVMAQVKASVEEIFVQIQKSNSDKWQQFESAAKEVVESIKKHYRTEMKRLSGIVDTKDFESQEKQIRVCMEEKFMTTINHQVAKEDFVKALKQTMWDAFDLEKQGTKEVIQMRQETDELHAGTILLHATRRYANAMDAKFKTKLFYNDKELLEIHEELTQRILATVEDFELNERRKQLVQKGLNTLFIRYQEENKRRSPKSEIAIGIDLGTTNCCIAAYLNGKVEIVPNFNCEEEKRTIPSYVSFNDDHTIDIGSVAREKAHRDVQNTIFDAKRLIGRKFNDPFITKALSENFWPFGITDNDNEPRIHMRGREYRPEEISAKLLYNLKTISEKYLNRKVCRAVITVPAYFSGSQRQATKDAACIAGLKAFIIPEPTAAAIAYKLNTTGDLKKHVLVFDLGGGTFDVVVIRMESGHINVLAIGGNTRLGGIDFDKNMANEVLQRVAKRNIDLKKVQSSTNLVDQLKASGTLRRLRFICEAGKRRLSSSTSTTIRLEQVEDLLPRNMIIEEKFTREEFNNLNLHLFQECIDIVDATIKDTNVSKNKIDDVVLVGGSTRILKIQEMLKSYFGNDKQLTTTIDPDEAVAVGAAYEAALRFQDDEGSIQEAGTRKIQDLTPLSLGVAIFPDTMSVIIPKNTKIPCEAIKSGFATLRDNQTVCEIRIFEGENSFVRDNNLLGHFQLQGVPPGPAGQEQLQCTMKIDEEGILHVTAQLVTNGKSAQLKIDSFNGRMTSAEKTQANGEDLLTWCNKPCLKCPAKGQQTSES